MARTLGPTVRRWQLGDELRRLREAAGVSAKAAAAEIEVTPGTMSKIEGGRQAVKTTHVKLLAHLYGLGAEDRNRLVSMAEEAGRPGYWVTSGARVPDWFRLFLGYERDATRLQTYGAELVHGTLQTQRYFEAIALANNPDIDREDLARQKDLRRLRQEHVFGEDPTELHVIMNEAVIARPVGGAAVMREQIEHLIELSERDSVTLQLLPFAVGAHPAMTAPFTLLSFDFEPRINTVYLDTGRGALYLDRAEDLQRYGSMFRRLAELALSVNDTRRALVKVASRL